LSYGILLLGKWRIGALIIGVATMDAGAQGSLVSNQTRSFALNPLAQNRINTLYTSAMFLGGAAGSAGSTLVWVWAGWTVVMGFCCSFPGLACVWFMRRQARQRAPWLRNLPALPQLLRGDVDGDCRSYPQRRPTS